MATLVAGVLFLGGEFMPKLEEGNLWVRATLPQDASYETGAKMAHDIREILLAYPEVTQVVSQMGRPDDGTDVTTFNNIEFMVSLKAASDWPAGLTKDKLDRPDGRAARKISRHRFQFFAEHSGQRRGSHVRREGRKFAEAFWRRYRHAGGKGRRDSRHHGQGAGRRRSGRVSGNGPARAAGFDRSRRERALRIDGRGCERGGAGGHWRASRRRRFWKATAASIS